MSYLTEFTKHIPGYTNFTHLEDLALTIRQLPPNSRILEIGCAYGRSTCCILDNLSPGSSLHTVDTFVHLKPSKIYKGNHKRYLDIGQAMPELLKDNLEHMMNLGQRGFFDYITNKHPSRDKLSVYQMTSEEYMNKFSDRTYDCVYLDGDHRYEAVRSELIHFEDTKVLCGDDWGPAHPGVTQAVDELRTRHPEREWTKPKLELKSGFWKLIKN